jgi:hypothetical protein
MPGTAGLRRDARAETGTAAPPRSPPSINDGSIGIVRLADAETVSTCARFGKAQTGIELLVAIVHDMAGGAPSSRCRLSWVSSAEEAGLRLAS